MNFVKKLMRLKSKQNHNIVLENSKKSKKFSIYKNFKSEIQKTKKG